jgi:hypothetical protein
METWRLTWGLDVFREPDEGIPILDSPDVNGFRMKFASREEAFLCKVEIQRYLGDVLLLLSENLPAKIERLSL